jgi:hypothetical protein
LWELNDVNLDPADEFESSAWRADDRSRAQFESWQIEWIEPAHAREFGDRHFPGLNEAVVWGPRPD